MRNDPCRGWREQLGAFVLGGIDDDERARIQAHLDGCDECRAEAAELRRAAAALPAADPGRVVAGEGFPARVPADLAHRVIATIGDQRRRRRRALGLRLAAALAVVATAAALAAALIGPGATPTRSPAHAEAVTFRSLPAGASIRATITPRSWGTRIHLRIRGFRHGTRCSVFLRRADGSRVSAGSFRYAYGAQEDGVTLAAALARAEAAALEVRAGGQTFIAELT